MDHYTHLDEVVALHVRFKLRLRAFIAQPEPLVPAFILHDNICPLGKWLYEQTDTKLTLCDEFRHLIQCHKRIHGAATIAANQAIAGDQEGAMNKLDNGGEFDMIAKDLMLAVVRLKKSVKKGCRE